MSQQPALPAFASPDAACQFASLRPRMTSLARRFASGADADDIVQNAYEKAVRNLAQFSGRSLFSTWLHRIVVNEALMWLRSERRGLRRQTDSGAFDPDRGDVFDLRSDSADPARRLAEKQRAALLRASVAELPEAEREVIERCGLDEVSYGDFCAETGIAPGAAKSRAFRARRRLREILEPIA